MSWFARSLYCPFEIPLEMLEAKPLRVDEAAIEDPLNEDFQFAQAEHRDGALPASPDIALGLRL